MNLEKAIKILEKHNEWRRDENVPPKTDMQNPTDIGNAIDYALNELKKLREADVSGQVNEVGMEGHGNGCGCWMCNDLRGE